MEAKAMDDVFVRSCWLKGAESGMRLHGVNIKVQPTGYLVILKVLTAEGPRVAFRQAGTIEAVGREVRDWDQITLKNWKEDRFFLDRLGT